MTFDALAESEEMVAKILNYLAQRGVRLTDVSVLELGYPKDNKLEVLFANAINWLINEGVVRQRALHEIQGGTQHESVARNCVLTSKGFALLSKPFKGSLTLGAAVRETAEGGPGYSNIGELLGGLLGGFTKTISS